MSVYYGPAYPSPWPWYQSWPYRQPPRRVERPAGGPRPAARDHGRRPFVINIREAARRNENFRTALWTGEHFQVTLMSIGVGEDIGLEVHPSTDQFVRVEQGQGLVRMGDSRNEVDFERRVREGDAVMIPAGKWHNVINTGSTPLKVYVIYAPPEHPFGTVHPTKASAAQSD